MSYCGKITNVFNCSALSGGLVKWMINWCKYYSDNCNIFGESNQNKQRWDTICMTGQGSKNYEELSQRFYQKYVKNCRVCCAGARSVKKDHSRSLTLYSSVKMCHYFSMSGQVKRESSEEFLGIVWQNWHILKEMMTSLTLFSRNEGQLLC